MKLFKNSFLVFGLFLALLLPGCSLFHSKKEAANEAVVPNPSVETTNEIPSKPTSKSSRSRKKITLVLGGVGVASFGTIGILKRLQEEGIDIELLVTSGWPTLFGLARGFMNSIHDLEWFAMRLKETDFERLSSFDSNQKDAEKEKVSQLIENTFKNKELRDSKIPIIIATSHVSGKDSETYDRGEWKTPLLRTMSVPGVFRRYPKNVSDYRFDSVQGLEISEARKQGSPIVVSIEMYGDYFDFLKTGKKDTTRGEFRENYLKALKNNLEQELKESDLTGHIELKTSPTNFSQKRLAIILGYQEGARLAKLIRKLD